MLGTPNCYSKNEVRGWGMLIKGWGGEEKQSLVKGKDGPIGEP